MKTGEMKKAAEAMMGLGAFMIVTSLIAGMICAIISLTGCIPASTESPPQDAETIDIDARIDPDIRPLDPCSPLLNQYAIPAITEWIPDGTCVKILCPEGAGEWRLMLCKKPDGEAEIYWEIP